MSSQSFYVPDGDTAFRSTDHTRGPWDPDAQHGGPPCALIGHVLESVHATEDRQPVRLTFEILRPVPVGRLEVRSELIRGGKRVELLGASLHDEAGTPLILARAWRIRTAAIPLSVDRTAVPQIGGPEKAEGTVAFFREIAHTGYVEAMETRFVSGGWAEPGPATAWLRMRHPLLPGVAPTPLVRTLIAADSGNGISAAFDGIFINPELTVHLTRMPRGEWVGMEAATTLTDHGVGLAVSTLHDQDGPFGRGAQSLLLDVPPT